LKSILSNICILSSLRELASLEAKSNVASFRSPPWWNDNCQLVVDKRKETTSAYLRCPSIENYTSYKRIQSSCSKILQKHKRKGWKKFYTQFNFKTPTSEIWSLIKLFKKRKLLNKSVITGGNSQVQLFQDTIAKLCPPCLHVRWESLDSLIEEDFNTPNLHKEFEYPFTKSELDTAVSNLKLNSAPGLDQIDYNVISSFSNKYSQLLLQIYNNILSEGTFPSQWKQSLMILILKPDNTGLRSISLLSCLLKILERMVYTRLQWYIESRHILPDTQLSFRPDRSYVDSLVILTSDIYKIY